MTEEDLHEAWKNARFRAKCRWYGYVEILWNDMYISGWDWPMPEVECHNWYEEMEERYG